MDDQLNRQDQSLDENGKPTNSNSFRVNLYSWFLILFLCLLWPLSIIAFFNPPSDPDMIERADPILRFYLPTIALQLVVLLLVYLIIRKEGSGFANMGYDRFKSMHLFLAIAFIIISSFLLNGISLILERFDILKFESAARLFPQTAVQKILWIILCIVVAFTEETAYRARPDHYDVESGVCHGQKSPGAGYYISSTLKPTEHSARSLAPSESGQTAVRLEP